MTPQLIALAATRAQPAPITMATATTAMRAVLIWGDDSHARRLWAGALADEGLTVDTRAADDLSLPRRPVDAWVLHINSGLSPHLGRLRALQALVDVPPLMVAAHAVRDLDQVLALEMGADDVVDTCLPAPVVAARLRALWRRAARDAVADEPGELRFGALQLSRHDRQVRLSGDIVPLTEGEFAVLWLLARHAGTTLPRREILRHVRGLDDHPMDRSIDSRIYRIRAKLGDNRAPTPRIRTVRNLGYALTRSPW